LFVLPTRHEGLREACVIQDPCNDGVRDLFDRFGAVIERRIGGDESCAGEEEQFEILDVNEADGGFPWDQDEFAFFLEHDIGGAEEDIGAEAVSDSTEGSHAARDDDHDIEGIGTADEGDVHAFQPVGGDALWDAETLREFLGQYGGGVLALDQMNLVEGGIDRVQQALGIDRTTGTGDGDEDSHTLNVGGEIGAILEAAQHGSREGEFAETIQKGFNAKARRDGGAEELNVAPWSLGGTGGV